MFKVSKGNTWHPAILLFLVLFFLAAGIAQSQPNEVNKTPVRENGLAANLHLPESDQPLPAVLVIGGSRGGISYAEEIADSIASQGFIVMSLAYFKMDSLPPLLEEIPLEYFKKAANYLLGRPNVKAGRIGLFGTSKGGEAILLFASHYPEIPFAVVANVPSHVVWQSINWGAARSSWTFNGEPVPFVPFGKPDDPNNVMEYYTKGLENYYQSGSDHADITVEKINGPILITSGKEDRLWPSFAMAEKIEERLSAHSFPYEFRHLAHEHAGHAITGLHENSKKEDWITLLGGTFEGNVEASIKNQEATIAFFKKHLL
jgi:dienelactone hydrolase